MSELPVIDLGGLRGGGAAGLEAAAREIGEAARGAGFFYVVNHGVPADLIAAAFAQSRAFFGRPIEEKLEVSMDVVGSNRGYSAVGREALDPASGKDSKEAFNIGLELAPGDPALVAGEPYRALNAWPKPAAFRQTLLAYFDACLALGADIHRAFARDLGLDADFLADKFQKPLATLRLLRYPPEKAGVIGAGTHTDYGNLTLLATDGVGGLDVRQRGGSWIAAPHVDGAFVVNIGDCLMRWTNGVYASTPHRVVSRGSGERYSLAFFLDPDPFALVKAIPSCVVAGEAPRWAPTLSHDYLRSRLEATYGAASEQSIPAQSAAIG